MPLQIYHGQTL